MSTPPTPAVLSPPLWQWVAFHLVILTLLVFDLGVTRRRGHALKLKEAFTWVGFFVGCAALFAGWLYYEHGSSALVLFVTGYLVEYTLSVDNLFVFVLVFASFGVPDRVRHRVLFWGILGALVFRGLFIFAGTVLIARFNWILDVFGVLLVVSAVKLIVEEEKDIDPSRNLLVRLARRFVPVSAHYDGARFVTRVGRKRMITPLLLVLVAIETTDIIFAVDSIPAIFSITTDPFLIYTSNVFAILGLRSLFFVLDRLLPLFRFLKPAISLILGFVGVKMILHHWYVIGPAVSLAVILGILASAVVLSVTWKRADGAR